MLKTVRIILEMWLFSYSKCCFCFNEAVCTILWYILFSVHKQGSPQFVVLEFPSPVCPAELQIQFHGGFSGQTCHLEAESDDAGWTDVMKFYPQDSSSLQVSCGFSTVVEYTMP